MKMSTAIQTVIITTLTCLSFIRLGVAQCTCNSSEWLSESFNETDTECEEAEEIDHRLPTSLIPYHYDLELQPFLTPGNFTFNGQVAIWLECREETNHIVINSDDCTLAIHHTEIVDVDGNQTFKIINITYDTAGEFMVIELDGLLEVGSNYVIHMLFNGELNTDNFEGFVVTNYSKQDEIRHMAVTHLSRSRARQVFPCFDEPQMKATFNITIIRMFNITSISNMPLQSSVQRDSYWIADVFEKTPRMSTYIVAVAVCNFDFIETFAGNTRIRIWARSDLINATKFLLSLAGPTVSFMEDFTGIPYPLPKLDIIFIPEVNFGGMENWGLITMDEYFFLNDNDNSEMHRFFNFAKGELLIHEIVHQWIGNLVTMKWWNEIWLNEGITTYITDIVSQTVLKNYTDWVERTRSMHVLQVTQTEANTPSLPLSLAPVTLDDIRREIFSPLYYKKGALIMRMTEKTVGMKILHKGLKAYLKSNMYGNVNQDDLWYHIEQEFTARNNETLDIKQVMHTWTLQRGCPLLTVTRNYENNTAIMQQTHFHNKHYKFDYDLDAKWIIPLMYTSKSERNFHGYTRKFMGANNLNYQEKFVSELTSDDGVPSRDEWILFNPSLDGAYIVNYDNRNWHLLIDQLLREHEVLPPNIRLHLLFSIELLQENELTTHRLWYSLLKYVRNEREELILINALKKLMSLLRIFQPTIHLPTFQKYLQYIMMPLWDYANSNIELYSIIKFTIYDLACTSGITDCINKVKEELQSAITKNPNEITEHHSSSIRKQTLCAVMQELDAEKWLDLWKMDFTDINFPREYLLESFSCTQNSYLLFKLIRDIVDGEKKTLAEDVRLSVFLSVIKNNFFGRQMAFKIFKENMAEFLKWDKVRYIFDAFSSYVQTQYEVNEIKQLVTCIPHEYLTGNEGYYRTVIQTMEEEYERNENNIWKNYNALKDVTDTLPLEVTPKYRKTEFAKSFETTKRNFEKKTLFENLFENKKNILRIGI